MAIWGQEKGKSYCRSCAYDFALHNMASAVVEGNKSTLANPQFKDERNSNLLKTFDYIVVNPPFSDKSWMDGMNITVKVIMLWSNMAGLTIQGAARKEW